MVNMSVERFENLKEFYNHVNYGCGKGWFGKIYIPTTTDPYSQINGITKLEDLDPGIHGIQTVDGMRVFGGKIEVRTSYDTEMKTSPATVLNLLCNSWSCARCRPRLKQRLFNKLIPVVNQNNIDQHIVFTVPGQCFRSNHNYLDSYKIMSQQWHNFQRRLKYSIKRLDQGKQLRYQNSILKSGNKLPNYPLAWIKFMRSQNNPTPGNKPGYCHLHTGFNFEINNKWIQEIVKKNNYKIGFTFVRQNKDFGQYLIKDYHQDEEWVIPQNYRHYSTSANISYSLDYEQIPGSMMFTKEQSICGHQYIEELLLQKNKEVPWEFYTEWFQSIQEQ